MASRSNVQQMIGSIINFAKSKSNKVCTAPCDGLVLRMHYQWSFYVCIGSFFTVFYCWYYKDILSCVSHFNAESQIRMDFANICLSYPFVLHEDNSRRYLLYYRWIHWIFLLLAGLYYIPRKISKNIENERFKTLVEDVAQHSNRYDHVEKQVFHCVEMYLTSNFHTHNGLYIKYIFLNVLALFIDIFVLHFLDFVLQGYFIRYGFNAYPFMRDPNNFTDYMSVVFPPFASCELDEVTQLTAKRKEMFGCHLTLMELYEKLFLYLWFWLIILIAITSFYIVFVLLMMWPSFRHYILRPSKPIYGDRDIKNIIDGLNKNCKVGDIYVLYRIKQYISHVRFYELIYKLSKEKFWEVDPAITINTTEKPNQPGKRNTVKQRMTSARPQGYAQPASMSFEDLHRQL